MVRRSPGASSLPTPARWGWTASGTRAWWTPRSARDCFPPLPVMSAPVRESRIARENSRAAAAGQSAGTLLLPAVLVLVVLLPAEQALDSLGGLVRVDAAGQGGLGRAVAFDRALEHVADGLAGVLHQRVGV